MDIPSLFMIPSAVSSGKVHSVFPNSTDADFDFNRDSDATRVNSEGLIERVGYYSAELITPEANTDFSSNTGYWTLETGVTIENGKVNFTEAANNRSFYKGGLITNGKTYKLQITISGYVQGFIDSNNGNNFTFPSSNGTHTVYFVGGNPFLVLGANGTTTLSIDNISLKEVTGDRARLNYEIEGGLVNTKCSLILEPQSTNLFANSNLQSGWSTLSGGTIVLNEAVSPEGIKNASLVRGNGISSDAPYIGVSVTSGTSYAFSVFAKAKDVSLFRLIGFSVEAGGAVTFDLSNGTISVAPTDDLSNAKIEDFGNGWYRCSVIATADGTGTALFGFSSFANTKGDNFYIYGAQFEQQSYPTSLIITNGSTQTRAAETCNGAGTSSILPSEEGILYCETSAFSNDGTDRVITISDGTSSNRVTFFFSASNTINYNVYSGGSLQAFTAYTVSDITKTSQVAIKWKANDVALWVDGNEVQTDTSASAPIGLNQLHLATFSGVAVNFYGKVRDIRVYNTKEMTDSEVDILLTKITS